MCKALFQHYRLLILGYDIGIAMPNQAPLQTIMPQNQKMQEKPVSTELLEAKLKNLQTELDREKYIFSVKDLNFLTNFIYLHPNDTEGTHTGPLWHF